MVTARQNKYYRIILTRSLVHQIRGKLLDSKTPLYVRKVSGYLNLRAKAARSSVILNLIMRKQHVPIYC